MIKSRRELQNKICALLCALFTAVGCFCAVPDNEVVCKATDEPPLYARVINENTPFFADGDGVNEVFTLPYTYYVRVLSKGELLSHVEFGAEGSAVVDGYTPTDKLYFDGQEVLSPYPAVTVTTVGTTSLYADRTLSERSQYIFANRPLKFLGFWSCNGEHGCYVEYNGKTGYVKEEEIVAFELPLHSNPLTFLPDPSEEQISNANGDESGLTLKILIIVCLAFAGILGLFAVTSKKTGRSQVAAGYYDENDYE